VSIVAGRYDFSGKTPSTEIRTHKSLAPYRECRAAEILAPSEKDSGGGTFDSGAWKWPMWGAMELLSIPFAMRRLQEP